MTICSTCKHSNYCEIVAGGYSSQVKSCRDYRKGVQTNEEWFCGLSTEEKAKWLVNSGFLTCTLRDCEDCKYYDKKNDDCIDGYKVSHDTQMWVEWLNEVHHAG